MSWLLICVVILIYFEVNFEEWWLRSLFEGRNEATFKQIVKFVTIGLFHSLVIINCRILNCAVWSWQFDSVSSNIERNNIKLDSAVLTMYVIKYISIIFDNNLWECKFSFCHAQPKLQVQLEAELALISISPTHPNSPPPGQVVI